MTIGEMTRQIEIWKPSGDLDSENNSAGWVLHKKKWAAISGETGMALIRRTEADPAIHTTLGRYSFRIYYDRSIDNTMQIREHGTSYDIIAVRHDMARHEHTYLVADQGGSNG